MFGRRPRTDDQRILAIRLELRSGEKQLPAPMAGAIVVAFSFANGPGDAAEKSLRAAHGKGVVAKILPDGFSLPVREWRQFVELKWPEFADQMPAQADIAKRLASGEVVFGPLIGFPA